MNEEKSGEEGGAEERGERDERNDKGRRRKAKAKAEAEARIK